MMGASKSVSAAQSAANPMEMWAENWKRATEAFTGGAGWGDQARRQAELVQKTLDEGLKAWRRSGRPKKSPEPARKCSLREKPTENSDPNVMVWCPTRTGTGGECADQLDRSEIRRILAQGEMRSGVGDGLGESGRRATTYPRAVACSPRLGSVCGYSIILKPRRPRVRFRSSSRPQLIQVLRQRLQTCECIV
jgi:hypothetical protein